MWKAQDLKAGNVCPEPTTQYTGESTTVKFQSIPKTASSSWFFKARGPNLIVHPEPRFWSIIWGEPMQVSFSPISCPIRSSKFLTPSPGSTKTLIYTWIHLPTPQPETLFSVSQGRRWCSPPISRSTEPTGCCPTLDSSHLMYLSSSAVVHGRIVSLKPAFLYPHFYLSFTFK